MKKIYGYLYSLTVFCILASFNTANAAQSVPANTPVPVTGIYGTNVPLSHGGESMPIRDIDFTALTNVIHYAVYPQFVADANGVEHVKINTTPGKMSPTNCRLLVNNAHAAGCRALLGVAGSWKKVLSTQTYRQEFAAALVDFMSQTDGAYRFKYDGLDFDFEPLTINDVYNLQCLFYNIKTLSPDAYITIDMGTPFSLIESIGQTSFTSTNIEYLKGLFYYVNKVNVMTYSQSNKWGTRFVWHQTSLYPTKIDPTNFGSVNYPLPSAQGWLEMWTKPEYCDPSIAAALDAKLNLGIAFYGQQWTGVYQPRQQMTVSQRKNCVVSELSYADIMDKYEDSNKSLVLFPRPNGNSAEEKEAVDISAAWMSRHHDTPADQADNLFISYDNFSTAQKKIDYARKNGYGVFIWELSMGYRSGKTNPDAFLQSIKTNTNPPRGIPIEQHACDNGACG